MIKNKKKSRLAKRLIKNIIYILKQKEADVNGDII